MSQAASHAWAFYREVAQTLVVWTLRDSDGFPSVATTSGRPALPFWSSRSRVERVIETVPAYAGFEPVEISWPDLSSKWVPGLTRDGALVGVNWSGPRAVGHDIEPNDLLSNVNAVIENPQ